MLALKDLGEEAKQYQAVMEKHATENMNAVAKCLLEMASAADTRCSGIVEKQCQSNFRNLPRNVGTPIWIGFWPKFESKTLSQNLPDSTIT